MAQNLQRMFCPSCGAPIKFLEGRDSTFCQYCGYQIFKEDTQLKTKLKHEEVRMRYEDKRDFRRFLNDQQEILGGIIIAVFTIVLFLIVCNS